MQAMCWLFCHALSFKNPLLFVVVTDSDALSYWLSYCMFLSAIVLMSNNDSPLILNAFRTVFRWSFRHFYSYLGFASSLLLLLCWTNMALVLAARGAESFA